VPHGADAEHRREGAGARRFDQHVRRLAEFLGDMVQRPHFGEKAIAHDSSAPTAKKKARPAPLLGRGAPV
jgi:hypothetical protein